MRIFARKQRAGRAAERVARETARNPLAHMHSTFGNQAAGKLLRQIQTKAHDLAVCRENLDIRPSEDSLESDADRMTDKVLGMSDSPEFHKSSANPAGAKQQSGGGSVLPSSGEPLSDSPRERYGPRFGHDFSKMRVHAGAQAAQSTRATQQSSGGSVLTSSGEQLSDSPRERNGPRFARF